jgi:hypothetical protein
MDAPTPQDPRKRPADDGSWWAWFNALFVSDTNKTHDAGSGGAEAMHHSHSHHDAGSHDSGGDSGGSDGGGGDGGGDGGD